ncbi:MAG: hypothetical protein IT212_07605 [Bacteroidia bacterium]|nr:hypothetical protein [Bacteroidia bacterium]
MDIVNTFNNGLHSDNHPVNQPEGTYRKLQNANLISQNGNHFTVESQLGTVVSFELPDYSTTPGVLSKFTPIGFFSFVDKLLVIATNNESATGGTGMVGVVDIRPDGTCSTNTYGGGTTTFETIFYSDDLLLTKRNRLDGYTLDETTSIQRVYWCDDLNGSRVINKASSAYNNIASGSIVSGNVYVCIQGTVTYNGTVYGPGQTAGTEFTGTATTTYTGTGKVINYISVNSITIQPPATVGEIDYVKQEVDGNLWCGMKAYCFRLKNADGKTTTFSPVSKPIHVTSAIPSLVSSDYQKYQGKGINSVLVNSGKSITITISDLPFNDFQFVETVAIEYDQTKDVIRSITKISEETITSSTVTIKHIGQEDLATFTVNDLVAVETVIISAKTMATFKARGFQANLKERPEYVLPEQTSLDIKPFLYQIPSDYTGAVNYFNATYMADNTGTPVIAVDGKYKVTGTGTVTYNAIVYSVGDVFVGVANTTTFTVSSGSPLVVPIIRIQKYSNGSGSYKDIVLSNEYWDYKGPAVQHYLGGYWRKEKYRIALLGIDKYRQPYFVRWLDDITIPGQSEVMGDGTGSSGVNGAPNTGVGSHGDAGLINVYEGTVTGSETVDNHATTSLNIMGLQIDGLILSPEMVNAFDSFAIVRCPRDKQILTQGLMFPAVRSAASANVAKSMATWDAGIDYNAVASAGAGYTQDGCWPGWFTLKSPEIQTNTSVFRSDLVLQSGDKLEPVARYTALAPYSALNANQNFTPGVFPAYANLQQGVSPNQLYSKWYYHNKYTGGSGTIKYYLRAGEDSLTIAFNGVSDFNNKTQTIAAHELHTLQSAVASGGRQGLFDTTVYDYVNPSYTNGTYPAGVPVWAKGENQKLLTNWVRPKSALYGGDSDAAKALNEYIFCGHLQKVDAQFKADTFDGTNYVVNGIQVFGGDCLVEICDNVSTLYNDTGSNNSHTYGIHFPCEVTLDVTKRQGRTFNNTGLKDGGISYASGGGTSPEEYDVNSAYSTIDMLDFKYPALPIGLAGDGIFQARARFSQVKTIGETTDNHRSYLADDYRDVDTIYGEINNLKPTTNLLFYWQNKAVGYFPVNQQKLLSDAIGGATQLGIGGVLDRFDNVNLFYGNQHQWSLVQTPDKFFWFDMRNRAMLYLSFGGGVIEFSTVKGMQSFFNNAFNSIESSASPNIFDSDQPIMGRGISSWYDGKYQTVYTTFKLKSPSANSKYNFEDFTVGVSRQLNAFLGDSFSFVPGIAHNHNNHSISVMNNVSELRSTTDYVYGDLASYQGVLYVCILSFSTGGLINPDLSLDTTDWAAIGDISDVNVHWRGDVCKFYGRVYDSFIDIVVNAKGESFVPDNYEAYGSAENYTNITVTDSSGTASDLNIPAYSKNYRYWDGSWKATFPMKANNERFSDKYIIVRFNKQHNVTNDFRTSLNVVKRLLFLKTTIRLRR